MQKKRRRQRASKYIKRRYGLPFITAVQFDPSTTQEMLDFLIHFIKEITINRVVNQLKFLRPHTIREAFKHFCSAAAMGTKGSFSFWFIIHTIPADSVGDNIIIVTEAKVVVGINQHPVIFARYAGCGGCRELLVLKYLDQKEKIVKITLRK